MNGRLKRETIFNIVRHGIFLLVLFIIQAMILPWISLPWTGALPLVLVVAAAGISHLEGRINGAIFGLVAGMLCDVALGKPTITMTIVLTVAGFISGYFGETLFSRRMLSYLFWCLAILILASFVQMFSSLFFTDIPKTALLITAGMQIATSMLVALPLYPIIKWIARKTQA